MAADSLRPHPRHGVQNPARSSLSAFPGPLSSFTPQQIELPAHQFRALPCGVFPSMPLIVWHAKPGVFPPFSPSSDFCLSEANSCRRAVWTGLSVAPCGQASAWLLSGPCIPCGVVARERIQSLTGPQRGLSGSTAWSDSLRWQGPVPGLEHQNSKTRWPYPLRRPIAFPNRSQFSVPN